MCATARQLDGNGTHGCQNLMSVVDLSYPIRFSDLMSSIKPLFTSVTILLLVAVAAFEGCASLTSLVASDKESLLSAAGFRTRPTSTPKRQALYSQLAPYKLERRTKNGKVLYTYADKQKGIVYIGGETEYQQYKRLALQQSIDENQHKGA